MRQFIPPTILTDVPLDAAIAIVNMNSPTVNDEIHAPMGGVRDSGWDRTGPRSPDDFSDVIWIESQRSAPVSILIARWAIEEQLFGLSS